MTELAQIYLGNVLEDTPLAARMDTARSTGQGWEVHISQTDSRKGRIYAHTTTGLPVGIVKGRDWVLREGDVLETEAGHLLLIKLQAQQVMVLRFTSPEITSEEQAIALLHLGHVLGNHHWPILIQLNCVYVELIVDAAVVESTIRNFHIPGLHIDYEWRSPHEHLDFSLSHHHHP